MIADRIASCLDRLFEKTTVHELQWKPIETYFQYYNDNAFLTSFLLDAKENAGNMVPSPRSYYLQKNDMYLVVTAFYSFADTGLVRDIQMHGVFHHNAGIKKIPMYFDNCSAEEFFDKIEEHIEFKKDEYNSETSEMLDFLEEFSS